MQVDSTRDPVDARREQAWREILSVIAVGVLLLLAEIALRKTSLVALPPEFRSLPALLSCATYALWLAAKRGDAADALGLRKPKRWGRMIGAALAILVTFILAQNALALLGARMGIPAPDFTGYSYLQGNWALALATWLLLIVTAALPEELLYRGFLLGRLTEALGHGRWAVVLAVFGQAIIFGLTHFQWGVGGTIMTTAMGVVWGAGYVLAGRNLWAVIIAHSLAHLLLVMQLAATPAS
ncbi:type II CAAX endopeptidase family protein [Altererythrobacter arenosus]|uniref:Type II CAAX endopeptidase family protein n=1 Tax=Altererythrobacter arenosus TaxID=3032592 RepID=A0ABY8FUG8_9SPHN|nr:type II CAAX endopeptidase family protein [Altererythrobacter sp. CAU 1644]WFL78397.1 type II CAAX endopeptidase family protein [Altererythrobacter sp. CAU 1644]